MYAIDSDIARQDRVTLHVGDPARSQEFYQDLFGLVLRETSTPTVERVLLVPDGDEGTELVFAPTAQQDHTPVWLSVEVTSVSEVLDLYLLAIMMGAKAMLPRKRGHRWSTVVTDPDGNRVSIWTRVEDDVYNEREDERRRPTRWEWRLSRETETMIDAELDRSAGFRSPLHDGAGGIPGRLATASKAISHDDDSRGGACKRGTPETDNATERKE